MGEDEEEEAEEEEEEEKKKKQGDFDLFPVFFLFQKKNIFFLGLEMFPLPICIAFLSPKPNEKHKKKKKKKKKKKEKPLRERKINLIRLNSMKKRKKLHVVVGV